MGDIALRTPAGARCPPSVRRLRPLPDGRAVGARGAAERGASDQTRKSSKGESAQTWIASAGSRIGTISHTYGCRTLFAHISLFSQTCCFLLGHLGSWLHLGRNQFRSSVGCTAALSEALCESNNADGYGALLHMHSHGHRAYYLYAGLNTRTEGPLRNPVPFEQRLPAAFATCTRSRSVVPQTHPIATPR